MMYCTFLKILLFEQVEQPVFECYHFSKRIVRSASSNTSHDLVVLSHDSSYHVTKIWNLLYQKENKSKMSVIYINARAFFRATSLSSLWSRDLRRIWWMWCRLPRSFRCTDLLASPSPIPRRASRISVEKKWENRKGNHDKRYWAQEILGYQYYWQVFRPPLYGPVQII